MDDLDECYFIEATDWCYWCVMDDVSHTSIFHAQLLSFGRKYECSVGVGSGLIVVPITGSEVTFDH